MPKKTIWSLAPHTAAKHALLKGYLGAWFPILASNRGRVVFLDGFAGPGHYEGGEPGSPVIAVNTLIDHYHFSRLSNCEFVFVFNEMDHDRFVALEANLAELQLSRQPWPSNVKLHATNENFQTLATQLAADGQGLAPTFAFIDPFGYKDLDLATLGDLLFADKCEIFCYFDHNSANRFATATQVDTHLAALFGCDDFKSAPPAGDPLRGKFLIELFERQLQKVARFDHVQSFAMRNMNGLIGHYMVFGTRSLTGLDKMKQAMWKVAPMGEYSFSDRLAGQDVLFGEEPDTGPLQEALMREFGGRSIRVQDVRDWVVANTPYHSGHLKRATLKVMQKAGQVTASPQRRVGEFVDGAVVTFA